MTEDNGKVNTVAAMAHPPSLRHRRNLGFPKSECSREEVPEPNPSHASVVCSSGPAPRTKCSHKFQQVLWLYVDIDWANQLGFNSIVYNHKMDEGSTKKIIGLPVLRLVYCFYSCYCCTSFTAPAAAIATATTSATVTKSNKNTKRNTKTNY
jgi:hypothetical protein